MAQYWPQTKAPEAAGLGLVLSFNFDDDNELQNEATPIDVTYPQLQHLPRHLLTQEEMLASMSMAPHYSSPLDAPRIPQCEFPRLVGPPLKMRRSFANHVPFGYDSSCSEDFPTLDDHTAAYPQQEHSFPEPIDHSPVPMRRTMAIRGTPIDNSDSDSELQEFGPIMAEPVVGIAITEPKYRQIAMWAVEVERQTKDVVSVSEELVKERSQPGALARLAQDGWLRWTCLTR